ncbi:GAF domain-containing protein [Nocardia farcinica]|uniref:GAF domain-containing protein n=1 Tax=Nocardia farcinica TaxID=37329 RepID=UPI0018954240|nr:GAF domain-containing protein [Nocardia farcinica]MBF6358856.1 GAF domain-containing protein [Nocardia farcinica]
MGEFSAITPGTDLPRYARDLVRMHDAVIGGGRSPMRPRTVVARSWSRVLAAGLVPDRPNERMVLPLSEVERRRRESPLGAVIGEVTQLIEGIADAAQMLMVVSDADGVVLWRAGSTKVRHRADGLGFQEGARWTEPAVGTNAIGTALAEAEPVQLVAGEHFEQSQHPWYCTAAPVHDPRTGELIGVVDVSGPALTLHPTITALIGAAVRLAEGQLARYQQERLERLRTASMPALSAVRGPALLVDEHGWVAHAVGVAAGRRIAVPDAVRAVHVPGLGLCEAEPLNSGWLVRPRSVDDRIRLTLDLSGAPVLVARGESDWRRTLSTRHAEILLLLDRCGAAGMTVAALSAALYGDPDHAVAVRAELSRLRRVVGSVVESRPYRLAPAVELTVSCGGLEVAESAFVRESSSPGVRALANQPDARR